MQTKSRDASTTVRTGVRRLEIDAEQAGQRIDNFLRGVLPGLPKGRLYRMLRRGEVRVNGGRVRAEYRLEAGDEVRVPPATLKAPVSAPEPGLAERLEARILFEDTRLLVVDKPAGIAVHGGSGIRHGVIELLRAARPDLRDLSLAHRLDRDTSGCLVLTKKRSALRRLHELFRNGEVDKNYLALAVGDWQFGDIVIDKPLLVTNRRGGERHVIVSEKGKPASTRVSLSEARRSASLLRCRPLTGRTHQIRVHLAAVGHPIAGDDRYGGEEADATLVRQGPGRLFLHAQSIAFPDASGNEQLFTAPLPDELERYLEKL
ncbi:MAG: RluA family pseudouridine synthase [Woeseiaceae bacterium]|nr:RluA family pseudouridine synthase [Woeseiaceae bacterium]